MSLEYTLPADERMNAVAASLREGLVAQFEANAEEFYGEIMDFERYSDENFEKYILIHPDIVGYFFGIDTENDVEAREALLRGVKFSAYIVNQLGEGDGALVISPGEYLQDLTKTESPRDTFHEDASRFLAESPVLAELFDEYAIYIDASGKFTQAAKTIYAITLLLAERGWAERWEFFRTIGLDSSESE